MFDLSIFTTPKHDFVITLLFLEIVLGVDNLVFIAITTNRLPVDQQHIGRKLGLLGALVMRILFLCFASFLVHMTNPIVTLPFIVQDGQPFGLSVRDIVLFLGGLYLIYKGIKELHSVLSLEEEKDALEVREDKKHKITLVQAIVTIMIMDVVFSIDSVITAVGLANHLIIMILAVIIAVILMMVFIDPISDFINRHTEMKILALVFIIAIGVLLVLDGVHIHSSIEIFDMHVEKLMVYFAMIFSIILEVIQMKYNKNHTEWVAAQNLAVMRSASINHPAGTSAEAIDVHATDELHETHGAHEVREAHVVERTQKKS